MTVPIYQLKAEFFKTLGHPARIRVLELLCEGEQSVSQLVPEVGIEASHLSQQLAILRRSNLVHTRKEGSSVFYSMASPEIAELLAVARRILTSSLTASAEMLAELEGEPVAPVATTKR